MLVYYYFLSAMFICDSSYITIANTFIEESICWIILMISPLIPTEIKHILKFIDSLYLIIPPYY